MNVMRDEIAVEILRLRERAYRGAFDLLTEQALKWCLPKHPHPLNVVVGGCGWCEKERLAYEVVHPASRTPDAPWWKDLIELADRERRAADMGKGFGFRFIRVGHPDGRWWVAHAIDPDGSPDGDVFSAKVLGLDR